MSEKTHRLNATSRYWDLTSTAQTSEYWWNITAIREAIQRRITGFSKLAWQTRQVKERKSPFGRVLAFGDGIGMAAEAIQERRDTTEVINLNISSGEGERFKNVMELVKAENPYRFIQADANTFDYSQLGTFDTIIDIGAFHHFEKFETIFPLLNKALNPGGSMYVDEYVGPSKYQFNNNVVELINDLLLSLPGNLVISRKKVSRKDFIKLWKKCPDPSEGIRAAELDQALRRNFQLIQCDRVGAALLQPFFLTSYLTPCRLNIPNWHKTPEGLEASAQLVKLEEELMQKGKLGSDYLYYVFGHRD